MDKFDNIFFRLIEHILDNSKDEDPEDAVEVFFLTKLNCLPSEYLAVKEDIEEAIYTITGGKNGQNN